MISMRGEGWRDMADKIRVIIVDDHPVFRQGLRNVLATHSDLDIIGEAGDGEEAIEVAQELLPDVVVMDINLAVRRVSAFRRRRG
jgi:DNA-binding NarL/FixJ family response regulator